VEEAVAILAKEGEAGLEKVGEIRFCNGNYVFVNDFEARTLMHIKPHLIGKVLIALKDDTGKRFFMDFTKKAQSSQATKNGKTYYNGSGWVSYRWPKPGVTEMGNEIETFVLSRKNSSRIWLHSGLVCAWSEHQHAKDEQDRTQDGTIQPGQPTDQGDVLRART
jgi:hypothetical protein